MRSNLVFGGIFIFQYNCLLFLLFNDDTVKENGAGHLV
jgi:hypothetical protein